MMSFFLNGDRKKPKNFAELFQVISHPGNATVIFVGGGKRMENFSVSSMIRLWINDVVQVGKFGLNIAR